MFGTYFRAVIAAIVVGLDVALLLVFLNVSGWLEPAESVSALSTPWPTPTVARPVLPTPTPRLVTIHVVKSGEVLADIATRYGLSVQDIVEASNIGDPNTIAAGQPLTIPVKPAS